ncbi:tyrosine-type recombinase/integrase [Azohydromonas australica]|uniref:tyrosine-type recombinase/integrase n=1 Tax=Azohydromonas australica TaxID=364039 RepID=UPI000400CD35|nr:tyrosine-type recombinase/integrase [Azohydromonas australica]
MSVRHLDRSATAACAQLLDAKGNVVAVVDAFLRHLAACDYSPNTQIAYAHDLDHLWHFFAARRCGWKSFKTKHAIEFLEYLRTTTTSSCVQRLVPASVVVDDGRPSVRLAGSTINRIFAAVSSFYDFAIMSDEYKGDNPIRTASERASQRVPDYRRMVADDARRYPPVHRRIAVKTIQRLPRPMTDGQVDALFAALRSKRDRALLGLMLDGGLRPGEALGLHLDDVSYGRRRVAIRTRNDHPKGARSKSRFERMVDLLEARTLLAVSDYVMTERPSDSPSPFVFLVGGNGAHRLEPLGYQALAKLFARACERAHIRVAWLTPHSLRHTHATRMWDAGMRELTLQRRLGHACPESTRMYTRISDRAVVDDYRRAMGLKAEHGASLPNGK